MTLCPRCKAQVQPGVKDCPTCGQTFKWKTNPIVTGVVVAFVALVVFCGGGLALILLFPSKPSVSVSEFRDKVPQYTSAEYVRETFGAPDRVTTSNIDQYWRYDFPDGHAIVRVQQGTVFDVTTY